MFKTGDAGMWYRKESPESIKSKKKGKRHDSKKSAGKFVQDSEAKLATQKSETTSKKVSGVLWSAKASNGKTK